MSGMFFDEKTLLDGNIFKYEQRLKNHMNRYSDNGMILTTYFSQSQPDITVDRGIKTIDELFGRKSPLRFNQINGFPINGFNQANPENNDELQIEDINIEGDATIIPGTIVPRPMDWFIVDHLKMIHLFEVVEVVYDSMKVDGFYKIKYRLHSTSEETLEKLYHQVVEKFHCELNSIGSDLNPIIREEDFVKKSQIVQMVDHMIDLYRSMYYNQRHNCFLFYDQSIGLHWFDMCGNEFMAKHSIMNSNNSTNVVVLKSKITDSNLPQYYANSVYSWLELGAPKRLLHKFPFILCDADNYLYSSFSLWGEGDIQIMQPIPLNHDRGKIHQYTFFDNVTFESLLDDKLPPISNEYEKLLWKFIHQRDTIRLEDVSLLTGDPLISGAKYCLETYLYTPIIIYIIREVLRFN